MEINELKSRIQETVAFLNNKISASPEIGIILGTGLGGIVKDIEPEQVIDYSEIPNFPVSTVESHKGKLIFGKLSGKNVVVMQGRFHYYEGYTMQEITFPVRVMKYLGVNNLIISNAGGSLNPYFPKGNIMIIDDHINLIGDNPLIGKHDDSFGPRFVDMSEPYDKKFIEIAEKIGLEKGIKLYKGVYAAMSGPSLETRAEYRFLRTIGADVIGMSTIPENIVARQMGLRVFGISVLTDECYPDSLQAVDIHEIIETASIAEPNLITLIKEFVAKI